MREYARALLTAIASFFLATVPSSVIWLRGISMEKATGLAAVVGGLIESVFSPWFWIFFLLCFTWLHFAGHSSRPRVRLFLFWIPSILVSFFGLGTWAGFVYLAAHHPVMR